MDMGIFWVENNKIRLNTYKITSRLYSSDDKTEYSDSVLYFDKERLAGYEERFVAKHRLVEIVEREAIDISEYTWMEGIELKTGNRTKEIAEIASYGSLEAYMTSLPEVRDEYLLDLDCRMSMLELGINGG